MVTQKRQAVIALEAVNIGTAISFQCSEGAEPLAVGVKRVVEKIADAKGKQQTIEVPVIWLAADPDAKLVERRFLVLMTAQVTTTECKISKACYVGTSFVMGQPLHIFDMGEA